MVTSQINLLLLPIVPHFPVRQVVGRNVFLLQQVTGMLFIFQDAVDHCTRPDPRCRFRGRNSLLIQLARNDMRPLPLVQKLMVNEPDNLCLLRLDRQPAALRLEPIG